MLLSHSRISIYWSWILQETVWSIHYPKVSLEWGFPFWSVLLFFWYTRYNISIHASIDLYCCSGESMENALRACCKGIKIGRVFIHRDGDNGKQVVYLLELICRCYRVFLCMQFFSPYIFCLCLQAAYIWEASQRYFRTACPPPRPSFCYWWVFIYLFIYFNYVLLVIHFLIPILL